MDRLSGCRMYEPNGAPLKLGDGDMQYFYNFNLYTRVASFAARKIHHALFPPQFQGSLGRWRFSSAEYYERQTSKVCVLTAPLGKVGFWAALGWVLGPKTAATIKFLGITMTVIRTKHHTLPSGDNRLSGKTRIGIMTKHCIHHLGNLGFGGN